jgi:hypothetical protein
MWFTNARRRSLHKDEKTNNTSARVNNHFTVMRRQQDVRILMEWMLVRRIKTPDNLTASDFDKMSSLTGWSRQELKTWVENGRDWLCESLDFFILRILTWWPDIQSSFKNEEQERASVPPPPQQCATPIVKRCEKLKLSSILN